MGGGVIAEAFRTAMPIDISQLAPYPDFLACSLAFVTIILLIVGVRESSLANIVFTLINLVILVFFFIALAINANFSNWQLTVSVMTKKKQSWFIFHNNKHY
jgi:amino acid transporter